MSKTKSKEIIHHFSNLKYNLGELLSYELEKTFEPSLLVNWILMLNELNMECPCRTFNFKVSEEEINCPFYPKDYFTSCINEIDNDELSCQDCDRGDQWELIRLSIEGLEETYKTGLWKVYCCLYLKNELKKILKINIEEISKFKRIEISNSDIKEH